MKRERKGIRSIVNKLSVRTRSTGVHKPYGPYERFFKRPLDFLCALAGLLLFSWLYLLIALLVRIRLGNPVLFVQERPGKNEKIFKLYKFRTMTDKRGADGKLLPDAERLTKFGKWLRSTSLDELPELINILKGDMSLIGPRPLLTDYLPLYSKEQRHRHDVRPGLTGLAQVKGRNSISWDEKFMWDLRYVRNISFKRDVMILVWTVKVVLARKGIQPAGAVVMEPYKGTNAQKTDR